MAAAQNHVQDKVIVITGAGGGFGRLTAQMVAALGASVVAIDIDGAAAEETVAGIVAAGGRAVAVAADVTDKVELDGAAAVAVDQFGRIDVMINNAGIMPLAFFADHERAWEAWDRAVDINIKGVVHGISAVYDAMIEQGRGHIVNIASIYGNRGVAGAGVYGATKAAVVAISDVLRVEAQGKIKVTVIRPTGVPATGLAASIVNYDAMVGIAGQNLDRLGEKALRWAGGEQTPSEADPDDVGYWTISPEDLAEQIVAVINTPWGITISDITVRATGEDYIL